MPLYEWTPAYSVQVTEFDNHHKKLFSLINDLHEAMKNRCGKEALEKILEELANYVNYHFKEEEKAMIATGYPEYKKHLDAHNQLRKKVKEINQKLIEEKVVTMETYNLLKSWIETHIMVEDKKYGAYFRNIGYSR